MENSVVLQLPCNNMEWDNYSIFALHLGAALNLTPKEQEVFAEIIRTRYRMSKEMTEEWVEKLILSPKITADLRNRLGLSVPHFQVIVTKLRKAGIIVGGDIYPDYRLNLPISKDIFNLTLSINFITK